MKILGRLFLTAFASVFAAPGGSLALPLPDGPDAVVIDPGPVGSGPLIGPLTFEVTPDALSDDCIDSNTDCAFHVQFEFPKHVELLLEPPGAFNVIIFGFNTEEDIETNFYLTDEAHEEIPGTRRDDIFVSAGGLSENQVVLGNFEDLILHDFHFEFELNPFTTGFFVQGEDNVVITFDQGEVGVWVSEPPGLALMAVGLMGLMGLAGLGIARRRPSG